MSNTTFNRITMVFGVIIFSLMYTGLYIGKSKSFLNKVYMSLLCFCSVIVLARLSLTYAKAAAMNMVTNTVANVANVANKVANVASVPVK